MPQFDFFATWDDDWSLLTALFASTELNVIPDKWYRTREIEIYRHFDDKLKQHITKKRRVFLFSKDTKINVMGGLDRQEEGPKAGHFSIESDSIGEVLELTFPACFEEDNTVCLGSGSLTYAKEFFNHTLDKWQSPSKPLIGFYNEIRAILKRNLKTTTIGKTKIWLGAHANELLESGDARITDLGVV